MDLTGKIIDLSFDVETRKPKVTLLLEESCIPALAELKLLDKLKIKITKWFKSRSKDANAYFWVLCGKLAAKTGQKREVIYRNLIRDIGDNYVIVPIRNDAVETYIKAWGNGRLGWICDELGASKHEGYTNICSYYGSSIYDTSQMARLIDGIVEECHLQGIETKTPAEIEQLKQLWREADEKHHTGS